jgi:pyruvate dehydrogenase E1 component
VQSLLEAQEGPVIAATDHVAGYVDQIRAYVPEKLTVLGTDGFGRSDSRESLRAFFEVDRHQVVVAALKALCDRGEIEASVVSEALRRFEIDPESPSPRLM